MYTVTAIIPAYNEQENIRKSISTVLNQQEQSFVLTKLIVVSDGSTDNTVTVARSFSDPRLQIVESPKRMGKSVHLNKYFKEAQTDIVAFFDADVVLDSPMTMHNLLRHFNDDEKVMLVGGNGLPAKGENFIQKAINVSTDAYVKIRDNYKDGNNVLGAQGCIMALRRSYAQQVDLPEDMFANDAYLYFDCIRKGYKFIHANDAIVWYRTPDNLHDHFKQNSRYMASRSVLIDIFGEIAKEEYKIPKILTYKSMAKVFLRHPIYAGAIFMLNRYTGYLAKKNISEISSKWDISASTKHSINHKD